jgi:hypothetical protein
MRCRALITFLVFLAACHHGAAVETMPAPAGRDMSRVRTLWVAPNGGLLGDALSVELARLGFTIVDKASTTTRTIRIDASEAEMVQPQSLSEMRQAGVDAMVFVRSAAARDGNPQSATVRIVSTNDGVMIGGATWRNGGAYSRGSIDAQTTARRIGEALGKSLGK